MILTASSVFWHTSPASFLLGMQRGRALFPREQWSGPAVAMCGTNSGHGLHEEKAQQAIVRGRSRQEWLPTLEPGLFSIELAHKQVWGGSILSSKALGYCRRRSRKKCSSSWLNKGAEGRAGLHVPLLSEGRDNLALRRSLPLMREDVIEPDPASVHIIKLDPGDVMTPAEAAKLLAPLSNRCRT